MPLHPGSRVGAYEVLGSLGEGGMGEVYRAKDSALKREVALKVLPAAVAADPDRLARFQREAEVLASLNHPHIAQIYGFESGALVMELVEGPTLADRIAQGAIPVDEALPIAAQIAEALEAAHEQGIVHRDLKPANIKVRPDGTVKVLDFGLAKAMDTADSKSTLHATMTSPAMTAMGVILGTASYMAPEQAKGKPVDKRADIWAFGCVLYEMLSGQPPFTGETITDVIAAAVTKEPDWQALPPATPSWLRRLLVRCLQKDPKKRLRDIGEARLELIGDGRDVEPGPAPAAATPARSGLVVLLGAAFLIVSLALAAVLMMKPASAPAAPVRLTITFPQGSDLQKGQPLPSLAFSPDGRTIVYTAIGPEGVQLWLRDLNQFAPTPIAGTADARQAFFSPDGKWIGFITLTAIKKVPITLGTPSLVHQFAGNTFGATWTEGGEIVFVTRIGNKALWRVPADGGDPVQVATGDFSFPDALPGGKAVVVTVDNPAADRTSGDLTIAAVDLASGQVTKLFDGGTFARYVPTGHLVYLRNNSLMAAPFDVATLTVGEARVPVVPGVFMDPAVPSGNFAVSAAGALAYAPGDAAEFERTLVTLPPVDARAGPAPLLPARRYYAEPRVSPDGRRIAVVERAWKERLWVIDVERQTFARLTSGAFTLETYPVWSPDGRRLAFAGQEPGDKDGGRGLFVAAIDGSSEAPLLRSATAVPTSWTPDGRALVFSDRRSGSNTDLMMVAVDGTHDVRPLLTTSFNELAGVVSPDGRWIAYQSNRSGRVQVHLSAFPSMQGAAQVSTDGGGSPVWSKDGRRLYYRQVRDVNVVEMTGAGTFSAPKVVARVPNVMPTGFIDTMPDGRLLAIDGHNIGATPELHLILNWFDELRQKVAAGAR
jgi:Tol biopolymer transport system component